MAFTGGGWQKIKEGMLSDPLKAAMVPHIPDIIQTGDYAVEPPYGAHEDTVAFHTFRKTVPTREGDREAIVDVAERPKQQPELSAYNLTREGTRQHTARARHELGAKKANLPPIQGLTRGLQVCLLANRPPIQGLT